MAAKIDRPKTAPEQVVAAALEGVRAGVEHVRADERAETTWHDVRQDPDAFERLMQESWDGR